MNNPKRNASGYTDPTADEAVKNTIDELRIEQAARRIATGLLSNLNFFGFEATEPVRIRHIKSGRRYSL